MREMIISPFWFTKSKAEIILLPESHAVRQRTADGAVGAEETLCRGQEATGEVGMWCTGCLRLATDTLAGALPPAQS